MGANTVSLLLLFIFSLFNFCYGERWFGGGEVELDGAAF